MNLQETAAQKGLATGAIDAVLSNAVRMAAVPGLVGIVADRNGIIYTGASGVTQVDGSRDVGIDTIFWLASMTKLVTTVAALQLVEQGILSLDEPIEGTLPELANPSVLERIDNEGVPVLRTAHTAITLRHLLTHSSGMGYDLMNPQLLAARGPDGPPPATSLRSLRVPLLFDPGIGWEYGVGIDWAGIAIERITGISLDRWFADRIFGPLAMVDTRFGSTAALNECCATFHIRQYDGGLLAIPSPAGADEDREFHSGGAGLSGSAKDYVRLLQMLLGGGELDGVRILSEATVAEMRLNQVGAVRAGCVGTAMPHLFLPYDPLPDQAGQWSFLGVLNSRDVAQKRRAGSVSWTGVAGTFFWIDPQTGICAVLLSQLLPFADPALEGVRDAFETAVYTNFDALRGDLK